MSIRYRSVLVGHRHSSHVVMSRCRAVGMLMSTITDVRDSLSRDEDRVRAVDGGALYGNRAQPEQHQQDCQANRYSQIVVRHTSHERANPPGSVQSFHGTATKKSTLPR